MRILYPVQQSVVRDKKWTLADSNINMMRGFVNSLYKIRPDWKVDVVVARLYEFCDVVSPADITNSPNVTLIYNSVPIDAFYARQNFNVGFWKNVLVNGNYDVVISNVTEHTRQLKTIIKKEGLKTKVIAQCFWMDTPFIGEPKVDYDITYTFRQVDGMLAADMCAFTCESTMNAFIENMNAFTGPIYSDNLSELSWQIQDKATLWDFGYDDTEFPFSLPNYPKSNTEVVNIGFLNRITTGDYTNFEPFIKALEILQKNRNYRDKFRVFITDPGGRIGKEWAEAIIPGYTQFKNNTREDYKKLLSELDISVHLFLIERYGGCALRESIASGNIPVVADIHEQSKLVSPYNLRVPVDYDSEGKTLVSPDEIAISLMHAIELALGDNSDQPKEMREHEYELLKQTYIRNNAFCAFSNTIETVVDDIENLVYYDT